MGDLQVIKLRPCRQRRRAGGAPRSHCELAPRELPVAPPNEMPPTFPTEAPPIHPGEAPDFPPLEIPQSRWPPLKPSMLLSAL